MAVALAVEDGTGVVGANSLATLAQVRAYVATNGGTVSSDDDVLSRQLIVATLYLGTFEFQGTKANPGEQYLPWPRKCLTYDGVAYPEDQVPRDIVNAAAQLCVEQAAGRDIMPTITDPSIKSETIGPIQTVYSGTSRQPLIMPIVDAFLAAWVVRKRGGLRTRRA